MLTEILLLSLSLFTNLPSKNAEPQIAIRSDRLYINKVLVSATMPKDSVFRLLGPCRRTQKTKTSFLRGGECGISWQKVVQKRRIYHFEKGISLEQDRVTGSWKCLRILFGPGFTGNVLADGIGLSGRFSLDDRRRFFPAWESGSDSLRWYSMENMPVSRALIFNSDHRLKEAVFVF